MLLMPAQEKDEHAAKEGFRKFSKFKKRRLRTLNMVSLSAAIKRLAGLGDELEPCKHTLLSLVLPDL